MQSFGYVAVDSTGKTRRGSLEAENMEKVSQTLKAEGLVPLEIKEQGILTRDIDIEIGGGPKARDFSVFCRQFVSMMQAGVTIIDALNMLSEQTENKRLQKAVRAVQLNVEKGETLANSMREQKIFPKLLLSMVDAGEASGSLDISFERMAIHFEKDAKLKSLMKKAMIYPAIVCVVAVLVIIVMLTFVIPNYSEMFDDLGVELPRITVAVMKMSDFVIQKWYLILLVTGAAAGCLKLFKNSSTGEVFFSRMELKLPLFGQLIVKTSSARFARTVSTLLSAGVPLVDAVAITADTMGNVLIRDALLNCRDEIMQGVPLSQPLQGCGLFPPMVCHMTRIGEEAGDIEGLLEKLADYYDEEVELATQSLVAAMEPMIIIILAAIVGFLIAAVMAPMMSMYDNLDRL